MTLRPNRNQDDVEREKTHRKTDRREEEEKQYTTNEREIETNSHQIAIRRRTRCYYHYEAYHIVKCCKVGKKVVAPLIYSFSYTHTQTYSHRHPASEHPTSNWFYAFGRAFSTVKFIYALQLCIWMCVCVRVSAFIHQLRSRISLIISLMRHINFSTCHRPIRLLIPLNWCFKRISFQFVLPAFCLVVSLVFRLLSQ